MKAFFTCCTLSTFVLVSCYPREAIPNRSVTLKIYPKRVQKSIIHENGTVILQSRKKGIQTNDLIFKSKDGSLQYLSKNQFFIKDFCLSKEGVLYYIVAGKDRGFTPIAGTRAGDFQIKIIDLNSEPFHIINVSPAKKYSEPYALELSYDERLLCFATRFGDIHVIDVATRKPINILPSDIDSEQLSGLALSPDKKSFVALVNLGSNETGQYIWKKRKFPLP